MTSKTLDTNGKRCFCGYKVRLKDKFCSGCGQRKISPKELEQEITNGVKSK